MTIQEALQALKPGAEWVLRGDTYEDLEWLDETQSKPTKAQVTAKMTEELPQPTLIVTGKQIGRAHV